MIKFVKLFFKDKDVKERRLFEELSNSLIEFEQKINRNDFNVYCICRDDEEFLIGDYYLPTDVYGEIYVEGDDIYEKMIMNRIEGTRHFVNWLL